MSTQIPNVDIILGLATVIVSAGARLCAKNLGIKNQFYLPNAAALLLTGMILGGLTYLVDFLDKLAKALEMLADGRHTVPGFRLYLPAYIFKTLFLTNWVEFKKSWVQTAILGSLGYFLTALPLGYIYSHLIGASSDSFQLIFMRGTIMAAVDPGDLLSGLGEIKQVRTLLEGEAVITSSLVTMFHKLLIPHEDPKWYTNNTGATLIFYFVLLTIAHIIVSWILSRIYLEMLRRDFCDSNTFISITAATAYLIYFGSNTYFSFIYPILSMCVFAACICPAGNHISVEVQELLIQFWDVLYFVSSSFVCFSLGFQFVRSSVQLNDPGRVMSNILLLYLGVLLTRFLAILLSYPLLKYSGLGITRSMAVVLIWGALRGPNCLGFIMLGHDEKLPEANLQRRSYGVGATFLNLLINGTTLRVLLLRLGFFTPSRTSNLSKALRNIELEKHTTIECLRTDESFANVHWEMVRHLTTLHQTKLSVQMPGRGSDSSAAGHNECKKCLKTEDLTRQQLEIIKLEARFQILKAQKISYTGQFARGIILEQSLNILATEADAAFHLNVPALKPAVFQRNWTLSSWANWVHGRLTWALGDWSAVKSEDCLTTLTSLEKLVKSILWGWYIQCTVILHFSFCIYTITMGDMAAVHHTFGTLLLGSVIVQSVIEFIVHRCARKRAVFSVTDVITIFSSTTMYVIVTLKMEIHLVLFVLINMGRMARVIRVYDIITLLRRTTPRLMAFLDRKLSHHFLVGYDVGVGFIRGQDETLKLLPRIVTQPQVRAELKTELEEDRRVVLEAMEPLAQTWPVAIISLKTRQCADHILKAMKTEVLQLQQGGLLDAEEAKILAEQVKELKSGVRRKIQLIAPRNIRDVIAKLPWLEGETSVAEKMANIACLWTQSRGEVIVKPGDDFTGILVVVSGMAKSHFTPNRDLDRARSLIGQLPCVDHLRSTNYSEEQVDYVWDGMVIGEISALTGRRHDVLITCETSVVICVLTPIALVNVLPTIRLAMWKTVALRIISKLLPSTDGFEAWPQERIKAYLDQGRIICGGAAQALHTAQFVSDVFLLDGLAADVSTKTIYRPPCLIPRTVRNIYFPLSKKFKVPDGVPPTMLLAVPPMGIDHINVTTDEGGVMRLQGGTAACPVHDVAAHTSMG